MTGREAAVWVTARTLAAVDRSLIRASAERWSVEARHVVDALIAAGWKSPAEVCQAREDGRREAAEVEYRAGFHDGIRAGKEKGRREAAEAIEAAANSEFSVIGEKRLRYAARLARGAQQPGKENPDGQ